MQKKSANILKIIGYIALIVIAGYIAYSVWYYLANVEEVESFQVCYEDHCVKTFHIHYYLNFDICGKDISLPKEHGPLDGPHTHKEYNYIHFHERLPYDPNTHELLETTPLRVSETMKHFDIIFNSTCIDGKCNGDLCPDGKPGQVKMFVNGKENSDFENYIWRDEEKISIVFK
jgi:hypothetical protein